MKSESIIRTFLALPIPQEIRELISHKVNHVNWSSLGKVRKVPSANYHITVKFLGDTHRDQIESIGDILQQINQRIPSFNVSLDRFGAFPGLSRPRTLWLGQNGANHSFTELTTVIEDALVYEGFPKDKRTGSLHLTLARAIGKDRLPAINRNVFVNIFDNIPRFCINKVVLYQSKLSSAGASYHPLLENRLD